MTFQAKTLAKSIRFRGKGLHSGSDVSVEVRPSTSGIHFIFQGESTRAQPENVTDTTRCTRLGKISTVEHLMSAFAGLEISGAEVELDTPEMPALDGAASEYANGLLSAGLRHYGELQVSGPFARVFLVQGMAEIAVSKGDGHWRYVFEGGERWPKHQDYEVMINEKTFAGEIAPARTFGFSDEIEHIRAAGLARGLDETTALVLGPEGYVNKEKFADEPARHKLLDLIGDLYLSGVPIRALNVVALRSGHTANVLAAAKIRAAVQVTVAPTSNE